MRLGYVGLGNMGGAIARRLSLTRELRVYDIDPSAVAGFNKAVPAASARELATDCDLVMTCLPRSADVRAAIFGPDGLAEGLAAGGIIADMTTGDPVATRNMAAELAERGIHLIDAPISGGPQGATDGTLAIMIGAPDDLFAMVKETFLAISPNVYHTGGVGTGHVMKAANNMLNAICRLATFEAVSLAVKNGLDAATCVDILQKSSGRNYATEITFPRNVLPGNLAQAFTLGLMHKDVAVATNLGLDSAVPLGLGNAVRETFQAAINEFGKDADVNAVAHMYERATGTRLLPKKTA